MFYAYHYYAVVIDDVASRLEDKDNIVIGRAVCHVVCYRLLAIVYEMRNRIEFLLSLSKFCNQYFNRNV